jgi:hypothetical protein
VLILPGRVPTVCSLENEQRLEGLFSLESIAMPTALTTLFAATATSRDFCLRLANGSRLHLSLSHSLYLSYLFDVCLIYLTRLSLFF